MPRPAWVAPGGVNHPFNIPVDYPIYTYPWYTHLILGQPVNSLIEPYGKTGSDYVGRLWNFSSDRPGNWNIRGTIFTYPLYYTEDSNDIYTISGGNSSINNTTIPFNALWKSADPQLTSASQVINGGPSFSDAQMIVVNKATGQTWDLWRVYVDVPNKKVYINGGSVIGTEVDRSVPGNATANIYTKENGWIPSRGMGMPYLMGLVVPEEIAAGEITHALSMPSNSIAKTFFLPPATKLEHPATTEPNNHPIPEGMRFCLNASASGYGTPEEAVDAWITAYHASKSTQIKAFARIVGIALFKYGWFITDTSQNAGWQFESTRSAGSLWTDLGIDLSTSTIQNLMDGLLVGPTLQSDGGYTGGNITALTLPACYGIYDGTFLTKLQAAALGYAASAPYIAAQGVSS